MILALGAGCGVQAGSEDADACSEVERFSSIKDDAGALDQEMLDLRPTEVTLESLKALAPRYREASEQYGVFLDRAKAELATSSAAESDFTPVWEAMTESLTTRRDGFAFFAETFANPENFQDPAVQAESGEWLQKVNDVNARVEEASTSFLREHGFEERADGQFVIDC